MTVLDEIFANKRLEVAERKRARSQVEIEKAARLAPSPKDFVRALKGPLLPSEAANGSRAMPLIAEIKRASPSRGPLRPDLNAPALAGIYAASGAAAISVLTEERYFQGSLDDLSAVAGASLGLPILRKDFIFDPYQLYEARLAGADAVLLIAAALDAALLRELHIQALALGMAPLVEVHNRAELDSALSCDPVLVGINNRDLRDFSVDLNTSLALRRYITPGVCVVAESGIRTSADVQRLADVGIDAILVGEALVTSAGIPERIRSLVWYEEVESCR